MQKILKYRFDKQKFYYLEAIALKNNKVHALI